MNARIVFIFGLREKEKAANSEILFAAFLIVDG